MSKFFFEDTCIFKADPAISGTIECTWSDVDSLCKVLPDFYIHKELPLKVRKAWFDDEKLTPGYVIIAFRRDYDGYCLVSESSLQLITRSLTTGDVVKKRLSDTQSGTVISTSLMCSLQPLCSEPDFSRQQHPPIHGHTPSHGPHAPKRTRKNATTPSLKLVHGFPASTSSELNRLTQLNTTAPPLLQVPASELKFWNTYREEDTVIYKGWIGESLLRTQRSLKSLTGSPVLLLMSLPSAWIVQVTISTSLNTLWALVNPSRLQLNLATLANMSKQRKAIYVAEGGNLVLTTQQFRRGGW